MKKLLLLTAFIIFNCIVFANTPQNILSYRKAKALYEEKDYGRALKQAEDAIVYKKQQIKDEVKLLENSLVSKDAKKAGDKINTLLVVLKDRGEMDCYNLISKYINVKGESFFNNSIKNMLTYIKSLEEYPEAQKLIGDIYKLEGEYGFAETYYLKALDNADVLDIPDEKYEILYQLADLSRLENNYEKMEIRLLNIIGQRNNNRNQLIIHSMKNTIKKDTDESINKLFELYRADDYYSMNAYCQLADYYLSLNEYEKALDYSAIAVITGFTKINNIIEKRDLDYIFTDITDFLDKIEYHQDILEWGRKNDVWKSYNLLCEVSGRLGYTTFSESFLKILAFHSPEKYWQQDAVLKLDILDGIKNPD